MKRLNLLLLLLLILLLSSIHPVRSGETVPPNLRIFNDDYFTVYGSPEMVVSITGNPEYDRDESSTLLLQIMNQGKIIGFESVDDPGDANEIALSKIEHQMEYSATTAVGVVASLSIKDVPLDIKTPPQSAGTLVSGQVSEPLQFDIKVWGNATAGTYRIGVNLTYQFQKDVQLEGNATSNQIDYNMRYRNVNEMHDVFIIIREQADFEVTDVKSELLSGSSGILCITFKNTGEETASSATARLRLSDPLSSTDYTAFLGHMEPDDEVQVKFNIDVDPDATAKTYSIKAEIEYEDPEGKTRVSDTIYVPAQVKEPEDKGEIFRNPFLLGAGVLIVLIVAVLVYSYLKKPEGGRGND